LSLDVGAPQELSASLAARPWDWIRFHAGLINDGATTGLQGGVSLILLYSWLTPTFTVEGGHFFPDGSAIARLGSSGPSPSSALMRHGGHDFGNAHLGLEIGSPERAAFFVRAGRSYIWPKGSNQEAAEDPARARDAKGRGVILSAKIGVLLFFM